MTLIADVLVRDPRQNRLINNGQARIGSDEAETRGELSSFVCEGRYADGIVRVGREFRPRLHQVQPAGGMGERLYSMIGEVASHQNAHLPVGEPALFGRRHAGAVGAKPP